MKKGEITIGFVGAGGDGVVVLGSYLQRFAALQGYFSQMPRYYGAQIRGGGSAVKLSLCAESPSLPKDILDVLVCFSWEKYREFEQELWLGKNTIVIYEKEPDMTIELPHKSFKIDFSTASQEATATDKNKNIIALGLLTRMLAFSDEALRRAIDRDGEFILLKENLPAFEAGQGLYFSVTLPDLGLHPALDDSAKLVIHGNAAMAQAAVRAGCREFFGYPITPSAEIMEEMQKQLTHEHGVFLQSEDEIASSGLVIGASLTGAKPISATSGPGFDLMTEFLGLASSAEIPAMIIDVQRCGPSTGIPSKCEQSDLDHAIYGGHGDAPRVVIAPYDLEGCYRLVIEGMNIAQYFQTPVILLSDQWLGQTFLAISDEFMKRDYPVYNRKKPSKGELKQYQRYQPTEDFVSPMVDVGDEGLTYRTTGLTHGDTGAPAFDFETQQRMHEKRWNKLKPLRKRDDLVRIFGEEECDRGIVSWGSSAQFVLETVKYLGIQNKVKVCIPELLYPCTDKVEEFLKSMKRLLVIEMNYSGQLYRYLRSCAGLPADTEVYCRAGGRPFSRTELTEAIAKVARQ
jgi:2-oxoglutarate ferredoxin oxidoreductase subunit alpha